MHIKPQIEITDDGSPTLRHPIIGDTYHSTRGAVGEAEHVFIRNGLHQMKGADQIRVLEIGFGSGLNALLTMKEAGRLNLQVVYHSVERYPVDIEILKQLDYAADADYMWLHAATWNTEVALSENFTIKKIEADLADCEFGTTFNVVYFDAFAPESQPELWSVGVFRKICRSLEEGGVLVTYSAKGVVKRALREAGFEVNRLEGALGKRHMLRAVKISKKP